MKTDRQNLILAFINGSIARLDAEGINIVTFPRWAFDAVRQGRGARWWLSARLWFGLSEQEADWIAKMVNE